MSNVDNDTKEIIDSFVSEGFERLEDVESRIQFLDSGNSQDIVQTIFRLFHSIKGSAGFLNFDNIKKVTHEAETLLDLYRKENIKPEDREIDLLYQTLDFLRQLIEQVSRSLSDEGFEEKTELVVHSITDSIINIKQELGLDHKTSDIEADEPETVKPSDVDPLADSLKAIDEDNHSSDALMSYASWGLELLSQTEKEIPLLESHENSQDSISEVYKILASIREKSAKLGLMQTADICMKAETYLERFIQGKLNRDENAAELLLNAVETLRSNLETIKRNSVDKTIVEIELPEPEVEELEELGDKPIRYMPLGEILIEMGEASPEMVEKALSFQEKPIGEVLVEKGAVSKEAVLRALEMQKKVVEAQGQTPSAQSSFEIQRKEIRVDTMKLDKLFDLVGELITAEAMVGNSPDLVGHELPGFLKSMNSLIKISREIQETTMSIRMIPLEGLFTRMVRLVRDLSRKFEKAVNFEVIGQETEMDKNVLEQISDPLVHLIRNALDHGIENKEKRIQAGKPETGSVLLSARYESNEIWISVKDDGGGLSRDAILKKAAEKELLQKDPQDLTDNEVWQFIFEPGFTTASSVSEISGRGVGMDVVRKNMEKIRGKVDVKSVAGKGTEFIMKIPLTMAIIDGITIRTGPNYYSIPLTDILEFFKAKEEQLIRTEADNEVINLRGEMLPLIRLYQTMNIEGAITDPLSGIIIVLHNKGRKAALLIDEIIENQQIVVKSLSEYLGRVEGIMGCSILGNGDVSLIIDTGTLLSRVLETA